MTFATTQDVSCPEVTLATIREQLLPRGDFRHNTGTVAAQGWLATIREQLLPRGDLRHYTGTVAAQGWLSPLPGHSFLPRGDFRYYPWTVSCPGVTFATTREHKLAQLPAWVWLSPLPGNSFLPRDDFRHYMGTQTGPTSCPATTFATTETSSTSCPGAIFATTREHKLAQLPRTNRAEGVCLGGGGLLLGPASPHRVVNIHFSTATFLPVISYTRPTDAFGHKTRFLVSAVRLSFLDKWTNPRFRQPCPSGLACAPFHTAINPPSDHKSQAVACKIIALQPRSPPQCRCSLQFISVHAWLRTTLRPDWVTVYTCGPFDERKHNTCARWANTVTHLKSSVLPRRANSS